MTKIWTRSVPSRSPFPTVPANCSLTKAISPLRLSIFNNLKILWKAYPSASVEKYRNIHIESSIQLLHKAWTRKCLHSITQHPGPSQYDKFAGEDEERSKKGFSLRPKTANNRNCIFAIIRFHRQQGTNPSAESLQLWYGLREEGLVQSC